MSTNPLATGTVVTQTTKGAAPLALAGQLSPVADIGSFALGLSEALAPDKGFSFNLCFFSMSLGTDSSSSGAAAGKLTVSAGPVFFKVLAGTPGESGGVHSVVELGIRQIVGGGKLIGVVELRKLDGFDTSIGDNLAMEVVAQSLDPMGVLLVVKGLLNPAGVGYAHFVGAVLVRTSSEGTLTLQPQFVTQAPPRGKGVGIFGKVIESSAPKDQALVVWAYRTSIGD